MGATAELPVPRTGATADLPVPDTGQSGTPEQHDVEAWQATAGEFRKGLRSSVNSLGASMNALAGSLAEVGGLEETAASRFREAKQQADFAFQVGPRVSDVRAIKDLSDISDFVEGMAGHVAGAVAPMAAAGGIGGAVRGLRGAVAGTYASAALPAAGSIAERVHESPASPGAKLAAEVVGGAAEGALQTFVPMGAAKRVLGAAKAPVLATAGKDAAAMAAAGAGSAKVEQAAHTAVEPSRDASGDTAELANSALVGAGMGAAFGAGSAGLSRVASLRKAFKPGEKPSALPADRAQTLDESKAALDVRDRPMDPDDLSGALDVPDDKVPGWLDKREADVGKNLADWQKRLADQPWAQKFKDLSDPEQQAAFYQELKKHYTKLVDQPAVQKLTEGFGKFVDKLRGKGEAKASEKRTAMDVAVYDEMLRHIDQEKLAALTPSQRLDLASNIKTYVLSSWAARDPKEPGRAYRVPPRLTHVLVPGNDVMAPAKVPHQLMDLFGEKLQPMLEATYEALKKGGRKMGPADFKKGLDFATKARAKTTTRMEDMVRTNLRDELLGGEPGDREAVVREVTSRIQKAVNEGADWKKFNAEMEYAFGPKAEKVMEAFDKQRESITRQYEHFEAVPEEESAAAKLAKNEQFKVSQEDAPVEGVLGDKPEKVDEASPYMDKRLGVPVAEADLPKMRRALEQEYDPRKVSFKVEPVLDKEGNLTGKYTFHAEDAEAKVGFTPEELERVREKHGKGGLENSVISVVLKDGERNKTVAVSIPNLVAETARTIKYRRGDSPEGYVHTLVTQGISRLMSHPDLVRFAPSTARGAEYAKVPVVSDKSKSGKVTAEHHPDLGIGKLEFPDDMYVGTVGGKDYTWGDVRAKGLTSRELQLQRMTTDAVQAAKEASKSELIEKELLPQMLRNLDRFKSMERDAKDPGAAKDLHRIANRLEGAIERVREEIDRRVQEGDAPLSERNRELGIADTEEVRASLAKQQERKVRVVQEETGLPLVPPKPMTKGQAKRALEGGTPGGPVKVTKPGKAADLDALRAKVENALKGKPKSSEVRVGKERATPEQEKAVTDYVAKVLGPKASVKFMEGMTTAGKFANLSGVETLHISTQALDPKGVGYHEAAHAVFARMREDSPAAANTLASAASSPTIIAQLRRLLASEPAALRQLRDAEERVAYMYEFWAAKQLQVGPNTKTLFDSVKAGLRKATLAWAELGTEEGALPKAEQILDAFHSGRLAERGAAARVLDGIVPKPTAAWSERLGALGSRLFFTADGVVRTFKVPAFDAVADKFMSPPEQQGTPSGFVQTKHVMRNQFLNKYRDAVTGADEAAVLAHLQGGDLPAGAKERAAISGVRQVLRDVLEYARKSDVKAVEWDPVSKSYVEHDLGEVHHYWPRALDRDVVSARWDDFVKMIKKHITDPRDAEKVAEKMVSTTKAAPGETDTEAGLTYFAPSTMMRKLNIPDAELAPFMKKDMNQVMYDYVNHMTRRAEYAKRFGNQGQGISAAIEKAKAEGATPDQVKTFGNYVQAMEGSLGSDIDPKLRGLFNGVMTYQNLRLLPLALFSSLVDPMGIVVRGGGMAEGFRAFHRGIRELVSDLKDERREFAKSVGAIGLATDRQMVSDMYTQSFSQGWSKWMNDKLFQWNGMESWNNSMRITAASAAHDFIVRHVERPNEHSERYLAELNLSKDSLKVTDGRLEVTPEVTEAINKWVDGAVLRPHAGIRPIWMSDPHFMLIGHLKQFMYSFQKTIVGRVVHEARHGNVAPLAVLSAYVPGIIAADILRSVITPGTADNDRYAHWGPTDWLVHGVNRAGITGPGSYALDSYNDLGRGKLGVETILGPTMQQALDMAHAMAGNGSISRELLRAIPPVPAMNLK